jgi:hypothetical protein
MRHASEKNNAVVCRGNDDSLASLFGGDGVCRPFYAGRLRWLLTV